MSSPYIPRTVLLVVAMLLATQALASDGQDAMDGFEQRRDEALEKRRERPCPEPRFIDFVDKRLSRRYATSYLGFALELLWQNHRLDEANAATLEICQFYRDNPQDQGWEHDSYNWAGSHLVRIYELFHADSTHYAGRLSPEAEAALLDLIWTWASRKSNVEDASLEEEAAWHIEESENHDAQRKMPSLGFARILKNHPDYRERPFADGNTAARHQAAWQSYLKEYLRERVRKGLFVEIASPGYIRHTLKGIYDMAEFSEDPELRRVSRLFLDLWWASWAEDQIDGVRGGGKTRCYQQWTASAQGDALWPMAWYYFGIDGNRDIDRYTILFLASDYRPPDLVAEIATDYQGRGSYESTQRRMGLARKGFYTPPDYRLRADFGGILRYSYVTPDYLMGSLLLEPRPPWDWTLISSQNRHQSVIFRGHPDCRIYPELQSWTGSTTYNSFWSVQCRGAMIVQKLLTSTDATWMRIRFASPALVNRVEEQGWVFVEAPHAFAAVRPLLWGYRWEPAGEEDNEADGYEWLVPELHMSPVVIQAARRQDYENYEAFRRAVLALPVTTAAKGIRGRLPADGARYTSLAGDRFVFPQDQSAMPSVNGETIDLAPPRCFDSPFMQSDWNSGIVTLRKGDREMTLDFNKP